MEFVIPVWLVAMIAGLVWARWAVAAASATTVVAAIVALVASRSMLTQPVEWLELVALGVTPWLLAAQRLRYRRRLRRLQAKEAARVIQLQERGRTLTRLQNENQQLEARVAQITDLYHVTKETGRALRVEELFERAIQIVPRLVTVERVRLIDAAGGPEHAMVHRAKRGPDGQLAAEAPSKPTDAERATLLDVLAGGASPVQDAAGITRIALGAGTAAPGALLVEGLPEAQRDMLVIIANQLSLQLARVHLYQTVETLAMTDSLTGLLVRRYFMDLASEELTRSKRHQLPCAFLMVDLDLFKSKNDTYGHLVGDVILTEAARLIRQNLREIDLMARYGGEEFIILLVETAPEQAMVIAERLRQILELTSIRAYDEAITQTISIGVACYPGDGQDVAALIQHADEALYAAKRSGRNAVVRWGTAAPTGGKNPGRRLAREGT